jgi:4a-hydroxytetrahydrobiopterin dehydratase
VLSFNLSDLLFFASFAYFARKVPAFFAFDSRRKRLSIGPPGEAPVREKGDGFMKLSEQTAKPVSKGTVLLSRREAEALLQEVPLWSLGEGTIERELRFRDFRAAMEFVNRVAQLANEQDHHPDIFISYNTVRLTLSTHKIGGLSMNDFIVAAKIDLLAPPLLSEYVA